MKVKPIITDTYDFPTLIGMGYVYVDKTAILRRLISGVDGLFFFLSRPRRFGKSLMISTLEQIFLGNRKLFKGLAIDRSDYDWNKYPVIRLDISRVRGGTPGEYSRILCNMVEGQARILGVRVRRDSRPAEMLNSLLDELAARKEKAVVLIDEYDAPLGGLLSDRKLMEAVRQVLHDFYITFKVRVADIRFLMMTGVSKFSKLSVFSGLNNLTDISMSKPYAGLLGYTPKELDVYFKEHIKAFASAERMPCSRVKAELLDWYDSYCFSPDSGVRVCNPVSVGRALMNRRFGGYWNETGNATLIIERIREAGRLPYDLDGLVARPCELSTCDAADLPLASLLYQGGYLTIKDELKDGALVLGVPNREVRLALKEGLLENLFRKSAGEYSSIAGSFCANLDAAEDLPSSIGGTLRSIFAMVPHDWKIRSEAEAKRYFLLFMKLAGADITPELESAKGRADAVLKTARAVYVFEFKYAKTARAALRQISDRNYGAPFDSGRRRVVGVGINYNPKRAEIEVECDAGEVVNEVVNDFDEVVNEVVKVSPGIRKPGLVSRLGKSRATIERSLARLVLAKLIEFRGAPKTGGYYVRVEGLGQR